LGHYDYYIAPGTYTVVVVNAGVVQAVYPDQSTFGFASTSVLTAGSGITIVGLTISVTPGTYVLTNPTSDQSILSNNLLPATANTTQSLGNAGAPWNIVAYNLTVQSNILPLPGNTTQTVGNAGAPWLGSFSSISLIGAHGTPVLSQSTNPDSLGYASFSTGLQINSSLVVDTGVITMQLNDAYLQFFDGGFAINVQAGPRGSEAIITAVSITSNVLTVQAINGFAAGNSVYLTIPSISFLNNQIVTVSATGLSGTQFEATFVHANLASTPVPLGEAVTNYLQATSTLDLPDITDGTSTPNSGFLIGVTGATNAAAVGHLLYYSQGGVLKDSGIGGDTDIVFFNGLANGVVFENTPSNTILLYAPSNTSGNITVAMPAVTGTLVAGITTSGTAAAGGIVPLNYVGFLEVNLPNGTIVKLPYYGL
jgi:hypothetical protein